jgi:hypothetical protein
MRSPKSLALLLVAVAATVAGCGSDSGSGGSPPPTPKPSAPVQDFPTPAGHTMGELQKKYGEGPIFAPSVSLLDPGTNRMGFALFDRARKQIAGAGVALYLADVDGTHLRGPYVARAESLAVKPQFESRTTASDPSSAKSVYVANLPLPKKGKYAVLGVARIDGRLTTTNAYGLEVGVKGAVPPRVGDKAIKIHTPTVASAAGDSSKIDTRVPPAPDLQKVDFASVVGKKPVVLMFATPQLCQSRVCGPVVDVEEQVQSQVGDKVDFIHMEIYNDNDVSKGFRPQVASYHLPTEPWTFVIDRTGKISSRFEGALSAGELERAVAKVQ